MGAMPTSRWRENFSSKMIANPACVEPGLAVPQWCLGETGKRVGKRRKVLIYNVLMTAESAS